MLFDEVEMKDLIKKNREWMLHLQIIARVRSLRARIIVRKSALTIALTSAGNHARMKNVAR